MTENFDFTSRMTLGEYGEYLTRLFLERKGYIFIRANYAVKGGEIDLIMQENDELVFVEVKTRTLASAEEFGRGALKIDKHKIENIYKASREFCATETKLAKGLVARFDFVEVYIDPENRKKAQFFHERCAFGV